MSTDSPTSSQLTVLFQPLNHIGLGHINRLSAIALALRQKDPLIRAPFVVEGAAQALLDVLVLPHIPLPSDHAMHDTEGWAAWSRGERSTLSLEISRVIVKSVQPQVIVFD